jgi:hypothetical protein
MPDEDAGPVVYGRTRGSEDTRTTWARPEKASQDAERAGRPRRRRQGRLNASELAKRGTDPASVSYVQLVCSTGSFAGWALSTLV